ncbi:MAG: 30S ribosomal protein S4 [Sandaracinaceae bacterium]|nr:30S ribosomal protein S4 [Sandaracinaceae bacterium]
MARYTGPVCKLCRRDGMKLFLKGERCYSDKCSYDRRPYPPGQHGQRRSKATEYGVRLREKQKLRRIYGMVEKQFASYFDKADQGKGVTGDLLIQTLERRLDNVVYRLGFARTRSEARQLVLHRHFLVNGKRVNIPSYLVNQGDVISIIESSRNKDVFAAATEFATRRETPAWVERDEHSGTVKMLPERDAVTLPIEEQLIVEFYSR